MKRTNLGPKKTKSPFGFIKFSILFLFCLFPLEIHAAAIGNEAHAFGAACTSDKANGADWDTLFQCKNGTWQRAPYFFGTSADSCDAAHAGIVQWTGTALQYCNGTAWGGLGGGGGNLGAAASATSPSRADDGTTGLFSAATGTVSIATAGAERMQVNASGVTVTGTLHASSGSYTNDWFRVTGGGGIVWETYGGGWNMTDTTWIRSYNNKPVYMSAGFDTGSPAAVGCSGGLGGGYNFRTCGTANVTSNLVVGGYAQIGYEIVGNRCDDSTWCYANCPSGKYVLGGGCSFSYSFPPGFQSYPNGASGWVCDTSGSTAGNVNATAICANIR